MVSITHTNPKYYTYQADINYLSLLGIKDYIFLNIDSSRISIPLEKVYIQEMGDFDLIAPINFQESVGEGISAEIENIYFKLKDTGAVCFYMQMKDENVYSENSLINGKKYRTNYYFDLTLSELELLKNQKQDAKQRLRKALKNISYELLEGIVSNCFYQNYTRISVKNNFSYKYRFTYDQFLGFSKIENIKYLELRNHGEFIAGGFFGFNNVEVDYLYGASNDSYPDSIRLLIWEAIKYFKNLDFKELFLGGGVSENDSLANFKSRLGCYEKKCSAVMGVLNESKAEKYMGAVYSADWFNGFFPPYCRQ